MRRNPDLSLDDRDSNLVEPLPGGTGRFAVTATTWLGCLRSLAFGDEIRSVRESMLRLLARAPTWLLERCPRCAPGATSPV